jgi:hypothetical protein
MLTVCQEGATFSPEVIIIIDISREGKVTI